jgi:hypothetical protein
MHDGTNDPTRQRFEPLPGDAEDVPTVPMRRISENDTPHDPLRAVRLAPAGRDLRALLAPPRAPGELGRLGPYRVLQVLGQGGMGVVVQAHDPHLQRDVALKLLRPELAAHPQARTRFLLEARAAAALTHDNVVPIYQVGEESGVPFLAMPLLQGLSLERWLERNDRPALAQVLRIARETARGLAAAHEHGVVHRDVKPGNIWLERRAEPGASPTFRVKLLDFGLACAAGAPDGAERGGVVGTVGYLAPEQAVGGRIDHRADLFGLGCVLYRLCTGRLPFPATDLPTSLAALATVDPLPPRHLNPHVPAALDDLILCLLARSPDARPATAHEVVSALQAIKREPTTQPAGRTAPAKRPRPRRRWLAVAAALGVALVAVGLATGLAALSSPPASTRGGDTPARAGPAPARLPRLTLAGEHNGHFNEIRCLTYSPDGRYLATGSFDRTVVVWDAARMRLAVRLGPHEGAVEALAFTPDSKALLTASADGFLRLWSIPDGALRTKVRAHPGGANGVTATRRADGSVVLASGGSDGLVRLWDDRLGKELACWPGHAASVDPVTFSPSGQVLASGSSDRTIRLWKFPSGEELAVLRGHTDRVSFLAFAPDGKVLASAGADEQCVRLWDVQKKVELGPSLKHNGNLHGVAFSPDGKWLAATPQRAGGVVLWDWAARSKVPVAGVEWAWAVAFSPDGTKLAAGNYRTLVLWDVQR